MLEELGGDVIVKSTIWTDGVSELEGVKLSKLVNLLGVEMGNLVAIAINDYRVKIPVTDAYVYEPIIAYKRNGAFTSLRDKGTLWIIYTFDTNPATKKRTVLYT